MEQYKINRNILCIDLKSYFASVECVLRELDPFTTPLLVADESRGKGGAIVLAVSPYLKTLGIPSRFRLYELPEGLDVIIAKPRMQEYLNYSAMVIDVYLEFISEDDLYIYSIDEAFLDVTNYLDYYNITDYELAKRILNRITEKLKLYATAGIGPNMLLAKIALDVESKKTKDFIAKWTYDDVKTKLWDISPLSKMWGIGFRMEEHLNTLGLYKVGDIANYDLAILKRNFGILGEELYYHTNGIDLSMISDKEKVRSVRKSHGISQVLFRDYEGEEVILIIKEMVEELARRLRVAKVKCQTIFLAIGYTNSESDGFGRQLKMAQPSDNDVTLSKEFLELFNKFYDGSLIRTVSVSGSKLSKGNLYQYSMFEDSYDLDKNYQLQLTIDKLKVRYGKSIISKATSELEHSTNKLRNKLIGGHHE